MPEDKQFQNSNVHDNNSPQTVNKDDPTSTQKVADTALKGAAEYFAPGVGGKVYDVAKKVPGASNIINDVTSSAANVADKVPGVKKVSESLDKSGAVDAINSGISKNSNSFNKKNSNNIGPTNFRRNNDFNNAYLNNSATDNSLEENDSINNELVNNEIINSNNENKINEEDNKQEEQNNASKGIINDLTKTWFQKNKAQIIAIGGGVLLIILVIFILLTGGADELYNNMGYYDNVCNYNETKVVLTNCYENLEDKTVLKNLELKEYVMGALYAYTKGEKYSDETLKAAMIVLKTNALSYGNYNNSSKEIELNSCSSNNYCDIHEGCSLENEGTVVNVEAASTSYINNLEQLYDEVSSYLYISSSYQSSITYLSSRNALNFNETILTNFEALAKEDKNFETILNESYNNSYTDDIIIYRNSLFMGDSRITGIMNSNLINESNTVYGIGYGYNWLVGNGTFDSGYTNAINGAIEGLNQKMQDKTSYNIIIWLGINDYTYISAQEYFNKYYEIASSSWANHNIYIVSLGPIDETKNTSLTNESINNFNTLLQSYINFSGLNNLKYIDLNLDSSTLSYDETGLHYSTSDYQKIYNIINLNIDNNISSNLSLYDLNEYCTYYNITENDSYWWPIGSSSPTEGNIYGGEPSTTLVTSYFGYRVVEGKTSYHQGIDISGGSDCYNNIIVAAKSGVVRYVNDTCSTTGYYGNQCGGEYGNWVMIEHDDGTSTVYAHMSLGSITVNVGDNVVQGQKIGKMGSSGSSTGCHLHFEVRINGSKVNPLDYVSVDNPRPMTPNFEYQDGNGSYKNAVCSTLLASGYSENAVAGIMVNLNAESGFSPINLQNTYEKKLGYKDEEYTVAVDKGIYDNFVNDSAGYGIAQWTHYSRKQKLYDLAKSQNKSIGALDMQIEFLLDEIATNSGFSVTHKYITGNYEANDIATNFCYNFERPKSGLEGCKKRANTYTDSMLNYVKNGCN